ncbi:hypothetical protein D9M68_586110 [compost metagenome]
MAPIRCIVTMAGNSFQVTVMAPKAPCRQTQTSVAAGHQALSTTWWCALSTGGAGWRRWRRRTIQVAPASVRISTPTPVAR